MNESTSANRGLYISILVIGALILAGWTMPARAQVWIDASQLGDRVPEWVDSKYYKPTPAPPAVRMIWVEPVYRTEGVPVFVGKPPAALRLVEVRSWKDSDNTLVRYEVRHTSG